jgi:hypothetical protein
MPTVTCLAVARRSVFGSLKRASVATGIPRSTLQKAESGRHVNERTRHKIEQNFGESLERLQEPFLGDVVAA